MVLALPQCRLPAEATEQYLLHLLHTVHLLQTTQSLNNLQERESTELRLRLRAVPSHIYRDSILRLFFCHQPRQSDSSQRPFRQTYHISVDGNAPVGRMKAVSPISGNASCSNLAKGICISTPISKMPTL